MKLYKLIFCLLLLGTWCACSEESHNSPPRAKITIITALNGAGDNGYNDEILSGVMEAVESDDIVLSLITPSTMEEAQNVVNDWLKNDSLENRSLLVLASNEYEVLDFTMNTDKNKRILLFESEENDLGQNLSTFMIRRYGISYLAGCMACEAEAAHVIAAMSSETYVGDAVKGFCDGYRQGGRIANVIYLAEDESGYSMPDMGYKVMKNIDYNSFVYPLAGGSNNGMYKSTREEEFCIQLIAGMDVDCSLYSTRIPFSVIFNIKDLVASLLKKWINGEELQQHYSFDLSDEEVVDIVMNPHFYQEINAWEDYYDDPDYWSKRYNSFKDMAIEKEKDFYENR